MNKLKTYLLSRPNPKWLLKLGLKLTLWYLFVTALLFFVQRSVMYQPMKYSPSAYATTVSSSFPTAQVLAPFDALVIAPEGVPLRTAVLFHGNGGAAIHRMLLSPAFLRRGYRLVLAEYPGYSARPGDPSEEAIMSDAHALVAQVKQRYPDQPLVIVGESLGSAVATQVAAKFGTEVQALVLITPFTSMSDVAAHEFPLFPARHLVLDRFESSRHIQSYGGPVRMLVADKDELVTSESGLALHDIAKRRGPTALLRLPTAGHNSWVYQMTDGHWDTLLGPRIP